MNLLIFINALLTLNIRMSIQKADALYKALGLPKLVSDLEYYRAETKRLTDLNNRLTDQNESLRFPQDQDLARLRAKLVGTSHDYLVQEVLHSTEVMRLLSRSRKLEFPLLFLFHFQF